MTKLGNKICNLKKHSELQNALYAQAKEWNLNRRKCCKTSFTHVQVLCSSYSKIVFIKVCFAATR